MTKPLTKHDICVPTGAVRQPRVSKYGNVGIFVDEQVANDIINRAEKITIIYYTEDDILDDKERTYIKNIVEPFKNRVYGVTKRYTPGKTHEYLAISYFEVNSTKLTWIILPQFSSNTMYKNMEVNREYTLEDLNID